MGLLAKLLREIGTQKISELCSEKPLVLLPSHVSMELTEWCQSDRTEVMATT